MPFYEYNAYESISLRDKAEDFPLQVSRGQIEGHRPLFRSAHNDAVGSLTTLWPKNTVYAFPASATTMTLYSSSTGDTTQQVLIEGLDADYNEISEILVLNGQTGRLSTKSYLHINTLTVLTDSPVGNISLGTGSATSGIPANTYGYIAAGANISSMAVYTVPANHDLYIYSGSLSVGDSAGSHVVTSNFYTRINGVTYLTARIIAGAGSQFFPYVIPLKVPEKSSIYNNASSDGGTSAVASTFNGILIKRYP